MGRDNDGKKWGRSNWELDNWEQARATQEKQKQDRMSQSSPMQNGWNQSSQTQNGWNQNSQTQDNRNQANRYQSSNYYYQKAGSQIPTNPVEDKIKEQNAKKNKSTAVAFVATFLIAICVFTCVLFVWAVNEKKEQSADNNTNAHSSYHQDNVAAAGSVELREEPESPFFQEAVEKIFGTSLEHIKKSDYENISSIQIAWEDDYAALTYQLGTGEEGTVYIQSGNTEYADLQCFSNLVSVDIGRDEFEDKDLYGLTELTTIYSGSTMPDLYDAVQYPENITEIGMRGYFVSSSYSGVENFPNVEKLYLDLDSLNELSSAAKLEHLKELTIVTDEYSGYTETSVFAELYQFTELEVLSIDSKALRDIGFLKNMTNLKELTIINAEILSLESILDRADTLEKLTVWHTYEVTDYSPVFELTNLTQLAVELAYDSEVPSLSEFHNLKLLAIGHAEELDNVVTAKGLEELVLVSTYDGNMECIAQMDGLKKLSILEDSIFEGNISAIASMQNLEELVLDESFIWEDISCLFSMPNLKTLSLEDAKFGIDFSKAANCPSLEKLNMNNVKMYGLIDGKWNYSEQDIIMKFSDDPEFFKHCPNLTELRLAGHELQDVNFGESLTELKILDITDSYVTDLTPLADLEHLQSILCDDVPIANTAGLEDILVRDSEW